jgi:hypothetical protein
MFMIEIGDIVIYDNLDTNWKVSECLVGKVGRVVDIGVYTAYGIGVDFFIENKYTTHTLSGRLKHKTGYCLDDKCLKIIVKGDGRCI